MCKNTQKVRKLKALQVKVTANWYSSSAFTFTCGYFIVMAIPTTSKEMSN